MCTMCVYNKYETRLHKTASTTSTYIIINVFRSTYGKHLGRRLRQPCPFLQIGGSYVLTKSLANLSLNFQYKVVLFLELSKQPYHQQTSPLPQLARTIKCNCKKNPIKKNTHIVFIAEKRRKNEI